MENRVYPPLWREVQLICHRGDDLFDKEGSMSPGG